MTFLKFNKNTLPFEQEEQAPGTDLRVVKVPTASQSPVPPPITINGSLNSHSFTPLTPNVPAGVGTTPVSTPTPTGPTVGQTTPAPASGSSGSSTTTTPPATSTPSNTTTTPSAIPAAPTPKKQVSPTAVAVAGAVGLPASTSSIATAPPPKQVSAKAVSLAAAAGHPEATSNLAVTPEPGPTVGYTGKPADAVAPGVVRDHGEWTTDRDPVTGFVKDADANNKPEASIARTWVAEDGSVHYTGQEPDGKPKAPWLDNKGWVSLTPDQQKAVAADFSTAMDEYLKAKNAGSPGDLDMSQEYYDSLDDAGKLEFAKRLAAGDAVGPVKQKITVDPNGSGNLTYIERDENGNLIEPWLDKETWDSLTDEQRQRLKSHYAEALRAETAKKDDEANNYLGTGMSEEEFKGLPGNQQADLLEGKTLPKYTEDGKYEFTNPDSSTVVKDADGKIVREKSVDGTVTVYGTGSIKNVTTKDGYITKTDNQGNVTYDFVPDSVAKKKQVAMGIGGFNYDGSKMSDLDHWAFAKNQAKAPGAADIDATKLTPLQMDQFKADMADNNVQTWSQGEAHARAAVQAGLLSFEAYQHMLYSDPAHSFGAWAYENGDIVNAVLKSNLDTTPDENLLRVYQAMRSQTTGDKNYADDAAEVLSQYRGSEEDGALKAIDPETLVSTDFGAQDKTHFNEGMGSMVQQFLHDMVTAHGETAGRDRILSPGPLFDALKAVAARYGIDIRTALSDDAQYFTPPPAPRTDNDVAKYGIDL